jgi:hypothetical protein
VGVVLDRSHAHLFTRGNAGGDDRGRRLLLDEIDYTVPLPRDSDRLDALGQAVGALRPSLFAYQFVAVAHTGS